MRKLATPEALRREEALILAWIGEVTGEKQDRLLAIRRRLWKIARAEREKRKKTVLAQANVNKTFERKTAE
jgi:hypothetical protein